MCGAVRLAAGQGQPPNALVRWGAARAPARFGCSFGCPSAQPTPPESPQTPPLLPLCPPLPSPARRRSDPEGDEEDSWFVRPWSEEERKVFADKFLLHHKARGVFTEIRCTAAAMRDVQGTFAWPCCTTRREGCVDGWGARRLGGTTESMPVPDCWLACGPAHAMPLRWGAAQRAAAAWVGARWASEGGPEGAAPPKRAGSPSPLPPASCAASPMLHVRSPSPPPACPSSFTNPPLQDFPKIATFLPGRSVQEVVRLYYAIQVRGGWLRVGFPK